MSEQKYSPGEANFQAEERIKMDLKNVLKRHSVIVYYILALLFSWSVELPLVAVRQGWVSWDIPFSVHYLAAFGPMLAALFVTALVGGKAGLGELWQRITKWRVSWKWGSFAVLSPLAIFLLGLPLVRLVKGEWPDLGLLGQTNYRPDLGPLVIILWLITFGFGEEIGWRGFALPRLQNSLSVSRATLTLGLMWAIWHIPAFFYHETYEGISWLFWPGFIFGVLCGAVIFTWIYNGTRGSVLMVAVWHALFDLLSASKAGQDIIPVLMSAVVIALALVIANANQSWGFRQVPKSTLGGEA